MNRNQLKILSIDPYPFSRSYLSVDWQDGQGSARQDPKLNKRRFFSDLALYELNTVYPFKKIGNEQKR
ncbi:hypothetical protein [Sphingobacterium sp. 1.A.5]|uniref:hypothetical protein n=1 Tax=Sphingobacterium sp. 1.A.5 TaxID=2044604 RepID=UPI00118178A6|nr:hypothetical protein [Sphingobacterium sp. 1.A.5]